MYNYISLQSFAQVLTTPFHFFIPLTLAFRYFPVIIECVRLVVCLASCRVLSTFRNIFYVFMFRVRFTINSCFVSDLFAFFSSERHKNNSILNYAALNPRNSCVSIWIWLGCFFFEFIHSVQLSSVQLDVMLSWWLNSQPTSSNQEASNHKEIRSSQIKPFAPNESELLTRNTVNVVNA